MAEETRRRKKKTNAIVWVILGLLILAMGGFGVGGFGSSLSTVASVGDRDITVQEYADAIQAEQARVGQQFGQRLTMSQMQALGLDRRVMERLLADAALKEEADRVGLSIGDAEIARRIRENPAFGGVSGGFDREGYAFALDRAGLTERAYEEQIRDEIARELLQAAVVGGTEAPAVYVDTLTRYVAETRDVTLTPVTVADLPGGALAPTQDQIQKFYDENPTLFETPELRQITYAWVTPDQIVETIEIDDAQLRQAYEDRIDDYSQPARVLAERLAFADNAAAEAALAAIEANETTFDAFVEERGLTLDDLDQGEIARSDVDKTIADALFALEEPGIVGPLETSLGPALYRVNAILNATEVPFEDARDDLAAEVGIDTARRRIDAEREMMDDLLAGGATLEELAAETDMTVDTIRWDAGSTEQGADIAAYDAFRSFARTAQIGDFPTLETLSDGGLFALRLDEIIAPTVPPLAEVQAEVEAAWRTQTLTRQLTERAAAIAENDALAAAAQSEAITRLARDATLEGTPASLVREIFEAEEGTTLAVEGDDQRAYIVSIDAVNVPDLDAGQAADVRAAVEQQAGNGIAADIFDGYGQAIRNSAGFTVNQQAVQQIQVQLGGAG
ncbi:peptidyl-prolyl cis-trans isomerase D [Jannaschia faecimaris]|uniref:Peptidyl-prolyl cis-trans isomerase D n=2 Tax=Jannaschia faecimaris TaxID=1244108 RepID=A0A1H3SKR0_9RHOB|nr:peptidyl-prolyl cis-trans isomerase D [Jannaschia faecimaris]